MIPPSLDQLKADTPYFLLGMILSVPVYLLMCGFLLVFGDAP